MDTAVLVTDSASIDTDTLLHTIETAFDQFSDQVAIETSGKSLTTYQLDEYCTHFAAYLQCEVNLQSGELVAVHGISSAAGLVAVYGAIRAGLQVQVLDENSSLESLAKTEGLKVGSPRLLIDAHPGLFGQSTLHVWQDGMQLSLSNAHAIRFKKTLQKADASQWQRPDQVAQGKTRVLSIGSDQEIITATSKANLPQPLHSHFQALITGQVVRF